MCVKQTKSWYNYKMIPNYAQEAKEAAQALISSWMPGSEQPFWQSNRRRLLVNMIESDIKNFLNWDVIRHTMYVDGTDYVRKEFNQIRLANNYQHWSQAIKEAPTGTPRPASFCPSSSENLIHTAFHVYSFEHMMKKNITHSESILEFGGGYGSMCRFIRNLGYKGNYVIFDLPEFVILQKYFLKSIGHPVCDTLEEFKRHGGIYCTSHIDDIENHYDVFIATWSISETTVEFRAKFLVKSFDNYLIAYQHKFSDVNNFDFFSYFMTKHPEINWNTWKIEHLFDEQYYLMGTKQ